VPEAATGPLRKAADSSVLVVGVGAWHGLGAAIARRFAAGGHPVVIAGRNAQKLETTLAELKKTGALACSVVGDAALPQNIHVGHVVVDGGIAGDRLLSRNPQLRERRGEDGLLDPDAIAEAYWNLYHQQRSAWTLELDLRPWNESF